MFLVAAIENSRTLESVRLADLRDTGPNDAEPMKGND